MSRYTVVGHSNAKPTTTLQPTLPSKSTDFLKNIVKRNVARASAVNRTDTPPTTTSTTQPKVSFSSTTTPPPTKTTTNKAFTTTTPTVIHVDSAPTQRPAGSTKTAPKSALKKTTHEIPVNKAAFIRIDVDDDGDDDSNDDRSAVTSKSKPQSKLTKSTTPTKSAPQTTTTTSTKSPLSSKRADKPTTKAPSTPAMPGFFSAKAMPEFNSAINKTNKRKVAPEPTPPSSSSATTAAATNKKQKPNDKQSQLQSTPLKSPFMSPHDMGDYEDDDAIFGRSTPRGKSNGYDEKDGDGDDEQEMDGFLSDGGEDDIEPTPPPKSKSTQLTKATPTPTKSMQPLAPKAKSKSKSKPLESDDEVELDGFLGSDDDVDDIDLSPRPQPQKGKSKQQTPLKQTPSKIKKQVKMAVSLDDDDDDDDDDGNNSDDNDNAPIIPQIFLLPPPPTIRNNLLPFTTDDDKSAPPTTSKVTIDIYYPQEQDETKQTEVLKIPCYDLETYQNQVHALLHYPYINTLHDTLYYSLQSELHQRFLYPFLPSTTTLFPTNHNLVSRSSSLHNVSNHHLLLILNEEMIRHQQSATLYNKFMKHLPKLKDNTFNNYEQWVIRNLSVKPSLLPQSVPTTEQRWMLFTALQQRVMPQQLFMLPTVLNKYTLHCPASRQLQATREKDCDILFGNVTQTQNDSELRAQLTLRGVDQDTIDGQMKKFSKSLKDAIDEVKNAQHVLSSKGCHPKDTIIKITEDINKQAMNQDVSVLYDHIREFDKISIIFHTSIGPISLSIPHTVKLIIMYLTTMALNHCFDDYIITKLLQLSTFNDGMEFDNEFESDKYDYGLLNEIITMTAPQLTANFTPTQQPLKTTAMIEKKKTIIIDGEEFDMDQGDGDDDDDDDDDNSDATTTIATATATGTSTTTKPTSSSTSVQTPKLTKQIAHILSRLQAKLPSQSILYQYIAMMLTGYVVTPKIPNLKQSTLQLPNFPQPLAQAIVTTLFRYDSLHGGQSKSGGGHQAAVPPKFLQQCGKLLNINIEAFASPLNASFSTYCSAFVDSDAVFGSLGSFFHFKPQSGAIFVNPPFAPNTILASIIHAEQLLAVSQRAELTNPAIANLSGKNNAKSTTSPSQPLINPLQNLHTDNGLMFMFVFPYKDGEIYTKWITSSPYCSMFTILPARSHMYTLGRQETNVNKRQFYRPARHDSILAILQNDKSKQHCTIHNDVMKQLLKYFLIHVPRKEPSLTPHPTAAAQTAQRQQRQKQQNKKQKEEVQYENYDHLFAGDYDTE